MYATANCGVDMVHMSVNCTSGRRRGLAGYVRTCGLDMVHMNADMPLIVWREQFGGCVSMLSERWATQCQRHSVSDKSVSKRRPQSCCAAQKPTTPMHTLEEWMYESNRVVDRLTRDKAWARGDPPPQGKVSSRFLAMEIDLEGGSSTSALSPQKGIRETWSLLVYDSPSSRMAAPCVQRHINTKWQTSARWL